MRDKFKKIAGAMMLAVTLIVGAGSFGGSNVQAQEHRRYERSEQWRREHYRRNWERNPYIHYRNYRHGWYDRYGYFHPYNR